MFPVTNIKAETSCWELSDIPPPPPNPLWLFRRMPLWWQQNFNWHYSAWGWVDNEWLYSFRWSYPLTQVCFFVLFFFNVTALCIIDWITRVKFRVTVWIVWPSLVVGDLFWVSARYVWHGEPALQHVSHNESGSNAVDQGWMDRDQHSEPFVLRETVR